MNSDLIMVNDNGFSQNVTIGVNKNSQKELFSIMNKAINNVDKDKLNTILTENINYKNKLSIFYYFKHIFL